jgi:hypothetical protein
MRVAEGLSPLGIIILVIFVLIIFIIYLIDSTKNPVLNMVLRKFILNPVATDNENLVTILGRKSGLIAWLLTLIKIYPEIGFIVTAKNLRFHNKSLSGEMNTVMTLKNVAHIRCEYYKPFWTLVLAIICVLFFIISASDSDIGIAENIFLTVSIVLFLIYSFNKSILIVAETCGGKIFKVKFKPSFIENVAVNLDQARSVVEIINAQIIKEQS